MSDHPRRPPAPALSFGGVADQYHRARPSYPRQAAAWLAGKGEVGSTPARVLELGAGTGRLTEQLVALGHEVTATDPSEPMLRHLTTRLPAVPVALGTAEQVPVRSHAVDVVLCAQAFHWLDLERALPEIARVLRPDGTLGLVWNLRDERVPWVRRLGRLIGTPEQMRYPTEAIERSRLFENLETASFRFWQPQTRASLRDLVASRSNIAVMADHDRAWVLAEVDRLYDDYGRGADGMLLPYVTDCYRVRVLPVREPADEVDTDSLLIDFR